MTESVRTLRPDKAFHFERGPKVADVLDFWQWSGSRLLDNTQRGIVAEFLVAQALGVASEPRKEWVAYDILYGVRKIEVKSAAYAQSWPQDTATDISYRITPQKQEWDGETNMTRELNPPQRTADIYIFALLRRPDEEDQRRPSKYKPDPLDLAHWEFSMLDTWTLDRERRKQETIALAPLRELIRGAKYGSECVQHHEIRAAVDWAREAPFGTARCKQWRELVAQA